MGLNNSKVRCIHAFQHASTHLRQESLAFVLEEEGEAIDNAAKDLKQLRNTVICAGLVEHKPNRFKPVQLRSNLFSRGMHVLVEDVVDSLANECAEVQ
jgi:hypothetical protein